MCSFCSAGSAKLSCNIIFGGLRQPNPQGSLFQNGKLSLFNCFRKLRKLAFPEQFNEFFASAYGKRQLGTEFCHWIPRHPKARPTGQTALQSCKIKCHLLLCFFPLPWEMLVFQQLFWGWDGWGRKWIIWFSLPLFRWNLHQRSGGMHCKPQNVQGKTFGFTLNYCSYFWANIQDMSKKKTSLPFSFLFCF